MISAVSCNAIVAVEFADAIKLCFCFFVFFFLRVIFLNIGVSSWLKFSL